MAMKRLIGFRSFVIVSLVAALLYSRSARVGLDLELGVVLGILNMWLMMRANERYLDGRVSRAQRSIETFVRLIAVGSFFALALCWGPWWSIAIMFAGLYTPQLLYMYELARRYRTGKL